MATSLGVEGAAGLTTVLVGQATLDDVVQVWGTSGLEVLASGPIPPNPAELLGSPGMGHLLERMRSTYDYVVVDTAPVLAVTDPVVLARAVDGTLVVANAGRVRRAPLGETLATLSRVGSRVLGVVLNDVRRDEESYSYRRTPEAGSGRPSTDAAPTGAGSPAWVPAGPRR